MITTSRSLLAVLGLALPLAGFATAASATSLAHPAHGKSHSHAMHAHAAHHGKPHRSASAAHGHTKHA